MRAHSLFLALLLAGLAGYTIVARVNLLWVATLLAAGLGFGSVSPLVAVRRVGFLAAAAPHFALLATAASVMMLATPKAAALASLVAGVALVYSAGYLIYRGADADLVTYLFVGFASAASVIVLYYASTVGAGYSIASLILGDPLLATTWEAYYALGAAATVTLLSLATYDAQVYSGIDRNTARLAIGRLWLYDLAFFTALGLASVGLIRVSGFILEHILILIPAAIAAGLASSAREALALSIASAIAASGVGGALALAIDIAPAGAIGLTLTAVYAVLAAMKRAG